MFRFSIRIAVIGAAMIAGAAQAVTFTSSAGAPDPGPANGESVLVDFNGALPSGYMLSGDFAFATDTSTAAAMPAGSTSRYLYTSSNVGSGIATLSTPDLDRVSFYWGSIDDFNSVDILGAGGATIFTLSGGMIPPADGNQIASNTNQRVFFTAGMGEVISGLRFRSTGVAFEVDDVAGTLTDAGGGGGAVVPEPAAWALMILGFGLVGASRRRARMVAVTA